MQTAMEKLAADMQEVMPYLLSGGAGALATGIAASRLKRDPKKSRLADLGRKLAITLGGGLAAAGIHKAVNTASDSFSTALPTDDVSTEEKLINTATNPWAHRAVGAGLTTAALTGKSIRDEAKTMKSLIPDSGTPGRVLKDSIKSMPEEGNKLTNWIDSHAKATAPQIAADPADAAELSKMTGNADKLTSLKNRKEQLAKYLADSPKEPALLKEIRKVDLDIAALGDTDYASAAEKLKKQISDAKNSAIGAETNKTRSKLKSIGLVEDDFVRTGSKLDKLNPVKSTIRQVGGKVTGRSKGSMAARAALIAAGALTPDAIKATGGLFSGNNE